MSARKLGGGEVASTASGLSGRLEAAIGPNPHLRARAAFRRRRHHRRVEELTSEILATIDVEEFRRRFTEGGTQRALGGRGSSKYIDLEPWVRTAVEHWYTFGFDELPEGSRVLDIGCGSGSLSLVARHLGHEAVGLDPDREPRRNDQIEFLGLERIEHPISPDDPLPTFERPFDLIAAFMMRFHRDLETDQPWTAEEWGRFLPALRARVADGGRVLFWLNRNRVDGQYLAADVLRRIDAEPTFLARSFANCLDLEPVWGSGPPAAGDSVAAGRRVLDDRESYRRLVHQATPLLPKGDLFEGLARDRSVLDVGCIDHSAATALALGDAWPHRRMQEVASEIIGLDLLAEDAEVLCGEGFDIRVGDAEDFDLGRVFDLVVAGDVIEHLGNPAGFLESVARHMHGSSLVVITTPNPFNAEQFAWGVVRGHVLVNDEHTMWLDPEVAFELVARSPLVIVGFHWIDTRFALPIRGPGLLPRLANAITRSVAARRPVLRRDFALVLALGDRSHADPG